MKKTHRKVQKKRLVKWLAIIASIVVVLAVVLIGAASGFVYWAHRRGDLHGWVEDAFHANIKYKVFSVHWRGISPQIVLQDVRVSSKQDKQQAITLQSASIKLNLLASLFHFSPVASTVSLNGLTVNINQAAAGHYRLTGFVGSQARQRMSWQLIAPWLQNQNNVHLNQTKVVIHRYQRKAIIFSDVDLLWQRLNDRQYYLAATSRIQGGQHGQFNLQANINGDLTDPNDLETSFYLLAQADHWAGLLANKTWRQLSLRDGSGHIEVWGQWSEGHLQRLHAVTYLRDVEIHNADLNLTVLLRYFDENILWQRSRNGWHLIMDRSPMTPVRSRAYRNQISVTYQLLHNQQQWYTVLKQVNLSLLGHLALFVPQLPKKDKQFIATLAPAGTIQHFDAKVLLDQGKLDAYRISGVVKQLRFSGVAGLPGMSGLSGAFEVGSKAGFLALNGDQVKFSASTLFPKTLPPMSLAMNLHWLNQSNDVNVQVNHVNVVNQNVNWQSQGQIDIPKANWHHALVNLASQFSFTDIEQILPTLLPAKGMPSAFRQWLLHAIQAAPLTKGQWIWRGQLNEFPYDQHQGVFQFGFVANDVALAPGYGWPALHDTNIMTLFDAPSLRFLAQNGTAYGVQVPTVTANIDNMVQHTPLKIHIIAHADAADALNYMLHGPLKSRFALLNHWVKLHGQIHADVNLELSYRDKQADKRYGVVKLTNVTAQLPFNLHVEQVNGNVRFDNRVLSSKGLHGRFMGYPLQMDIDTSAADKGGLGLRNILTAKGIFNTQVLMSQLPPALRVISGKSPFTFQFIWHNNLANFNLSSNAMGIGIDLPAPFHKAPQTIMPIHLSGNIGKQAQYNFQAGDMLAARVQIQHQLTQHQVKKAAIVIGVAQLPTLPAANEIKITGIIPYLSLTVWHQRFQRLLAAIPALRKMHKARPTIVKLLIPWSKVYASIEVGTLNAFHYQLSNIHASLSRVDQQWQMGLESADMLGTVMLPMDWQKPHYLADFEFLNLPQTPGAKKQTTSLDKLTAHTMQKWPAIDFTATHLQLGQDQYGMVKWSSRPLPNGILVSNAEIENPYLSANVHGDITTAGKTRDKIVIVGTLTGKNWGAALTEFGYPKLMNRGEGPIHLNLSWLGRLNKPELETLAGRADFDLQDGSISKVDPGIMKVLGIFNFTGLLQQVISSFSGFGKGLTFNELKGSYVIKNSIASTKDFRLTGQAMDLIMKGQIDLKNKTLDQTVIVIPHLSGGIAIAAGIIGGPIVGIATWLGEKLIGNTILRNKGLVFYVHGPWSKPIISQSKQSSKGTST